MDNNPWLLFPHKNNENFMSSDGFASRFCNTSIPNKSLEVNERQLLGEEGQLISSKNMFSDSSVSQQDKNFIHPSSKLPAEQNISSRAPLQELKIASSSEIPYYSVSHSQNESRPSVTFAATPNTYGAMRKQLPISTLPSEKQSANLLVNCNSNLRSAANSVFSSASKYNEHNASQTARPYMENVSFSQPQRPPQTPITMQPWNQKQNNQQSSGRLLQDDSVRPRNEQYNDSLHNFIHTNKSNIISECDSASKQSTGGGNMYDSRLLQSASKYGNSSIKNESYSCKDMSFTVPSFMRKLSEAHAFLSQLPLRVDNTTSKVSDDEEDSSSSEEDFIDNEDKEITEGFDETSRHNSELSENIMQVQVSSTNIFDLPGNSVSDEKVKCFKEQLKTFLPELVDNYETYPLVTTISSDVPRPSGDVFSSRTPVSSNVPYFSDSCIPSSVNNVYCRTVKQKNDSSLNMMANNFPTHFTKPNIDLLACTPLSGKGEQNFLSAFPVSSTNSNSVKSTYSHNLSHRSLSVVEEKRQLVEINHPNNLFPFSLTKEQSINACNSLPLNGSNALGGISGRGCSSNNLSDIFRSNSGKSGVITSMAVPSTYSSNTQSVISQSCLPSLAVPSNKLLVQPQNRYSAEDKSFHQFENKFCSNINSAGALSHQNPEFEHSVSTNISGGDFAPITSSAQNLNKYQSFSNSLSKIFERRAISDIPETSSDLFKIERQMPYSTSENVSGLLPSTKVNIKLDSQLQSCFETEELQKKVVVTSEHKIDEQSSLNQINSTILENQEETGQESQLIGKHDVGSKSSLNSQSLSNGSLQPRHPSVSVSVNNASYSDLPNISSTDKAIDSILSHDSKSLEHRASVVKSAVIHKTQKPNSSDVFETAGKEKGSHETLPAFADSKTLQVNGKSYIILGLLGKGGSSKVFQVYDPVKKRILAVKCVNLEGVDVAMKSGFTNEIALLCKLQGSNHVIKLYDYENNEEQLLVVLEKGDTDLSSLLRSVTEMKKVTPTMIKFYWSQMLEAVAEIHKAGIIHSDLKPANFLLVAGQLKLIDFGIASTVQTDMTSVIKDSQMGTVNFMSPEAIQDTRQSPKYDDRGVRQPQIKISVKSDVWSLGCILYNLVYGHTPFQQIPNILAKVNAIVNPNYQIPFQEIDDPHLLDVLKSCLIRDPKKRPSIEELLSHPYLSSECNKDIGTSRPSDKNLRSVIARLQTLTPRRIGRIAQIVENLQLNDDTKSSQTPENALNKKT